MNGARAGVALVVAVALASAAVGPAARAEPQVSIRGSSGGGYVSGGPDDADGFFEMGVRSEVLFGPDAVDRVRVGPALDLRTRDFVTAEAALGGALLVPAASGFPLLVTAGAGYASREGPFDGPFVLGTLAFGFRPYNHHSVYGFGLAVYATGRVALDEPRTWELSFGLEIDLEFTIAIPAIFLWELVTGGDPDEPT